MSTHQFYFTIFRRIETFCLTFHALLKQRAGLFAAFLALRKANLPCFPKIQNRTHLLPNLISSIISSITNLLSEEKPDTQLIYHNKTANAINAEDWIIKEMCPICTFLIKTHRVASIRARKVVIRLRHLNFVPSQAYSTHKRYSSVLVFTIFTN